MMKQNLPKLLIPVIFFLSLCFVVYFIEPPQSLDQASLGQLGFFFVPLCLLLIYLVNFYFHYWIKSAIFSLGLLTLLILQGLNILDAITGLVTLIITIFILYSLKRPILYSKTLKSQPLRRLKKQ